MRKDIIQIRQVHKSKERSGHLLCRKCPDRVLLCWRRGRDSNPCGLAPKRFSRLVPFRKHSRAVLSAEPRFIAPCFRYTLAKRPHSGFFASLTRYDRFRNEKKHAFACLWRRGRDSNPCGVAPKRFSRPPRYDRFDTSPYGVCGS